MNESPRANLLIVDDVPANLRVLTSILAARGYKVRSTPDGALALQAAQSSPPDLILLDIMMPEMDGYTVCAHLKADERTRDIPIIFLSALSETMDKVRAFSSGGVDYVTKPFQPDEVLARVETHLALHRLQKQLEEKNQALTAVNAALATANARITALNERLNTLLRQFASKEVADELLAQGLALGGRYVEATAMFADIRGFMEITESQPPELTIEMLNDYYAYMIEAVSSEGGIVNQILGDGIMCIFGAPVHYEDHAQRAVRAALKMMDRLAVFNAEQAARGRVQIRIGIGIATGMGVAGYIGAQTRLNYTWVCDATNLASRLDTWTKQVGKPILIDENTRSRLDDSFRVEDEGEADIRGKARPVRIFSVNIRGA